MISQITIPCSVLLLAVIVSHTEAELYSIESAASLSGAPVGFYRKSGLGRGEENILSLSGAKVGVYSKQERFQPLLVPVSYGRFLPALGPKQSAYTPPRGVPKPAQPAPKPSTAKPTKSLKSTTKPKAGVGGRNLVGSLLGGVLG